MKKDYTVSQLQTQYITSYYPPSAKDRWNAELEEKTFDQPKLLSALDWRSNSNTGNTPANAI